MPPEPLGLKVTVNTCPVVVTVMVRFTEVEPCVKVIEYVPGSRVKVTVPCESVIADSPSVGIETVTPWTGFP